MKELELKKRLSTVMSTCVVLHNEMGMGSARHISVFYYNKYNTIHEPKKWVQRSI